MPAFFITFHTYGTWLHGHPEGSVDPRSNTINTPRLPPNPRLHQRDEEFAGEPVILNALQRGVTHATIEHICAYKRWPIHQLEVRTTHVHLIVSGHPEPEPILNSAKSWTTRIMAAAEVFPEKTKAWSRHGSTVWLNTRGQFDGAMKYVSEEQGPPLPRELPAGFDIERLIRLSARVRNETRP